MFNRKPTRTVTVDGQPIECSEESAAAIEHLQRQLADTAAVNQRLRADQATVVEVKDAEIAALKADLAQLQASRPNPEDIDRLVDERVRRMADSAASVQPANDSRRTDQDPVAKALRDGAGLRTVVQDNGYGEFVASLDYRTRKQEG
ncbi:hypothetical protein [uncultured Xanthomonas sp.]|uniref:hypothetical protein n=1 Tax=uncultured Xanthomonas sp. TaxID=152831 RepID=UPI0025DD6EAA|nr:hypothetical protein [uncultured Xanthomonas sp.]